VRTSAIAEKYSLPEARISGRGAHHTRLGEGVKKHVGLYGILTPGLPLCEALNIGYWRFLSEIGRFIEQKEATRSTWHAYCSFVFDKEGLCKDSRKTEVSKISNIVDFLEAGMKAESLRQQAITNNVANMQTPGYRRIDVNFEQLLTKAMDSRGAAELDKITPQIYQPQQTPVGANGNDVNLEGEVGEMVKNTLRHKAYVRLLNKKYLQMEAAINVR